MKSFDFDICQIYSDAHNLVALPAFKHAAERHSIGLVRKTLLAGEHLERIIKKYPDWKLCDNAKKLLDDYLRIMRRATISTGPR